MPLLISFIREVSALKWLKMNRFDNMLKLSLKLYLMLYPKSIRKKRVQKIELMQLFLQFGIHEV